MSSVGEYQKRAEQCAERAHLVTRADDRARWLELADQWSALSRIEFQKLPARRDQPTALWRGERSERVDVKIELSEPSHVLADQGSNIRRSA
jgi:hypothetical protein